MSCDYGNVRSQDRGCELAKYGQEAYDYFKTKRLRPFCNKVNIYVTTIFPYICAVMGCNVYCRPEIFNMDRVRRIRLIAHEIAHVFIDHPDLWVLESAVEGAANVFSREKYGHCSTWTARWLLKNLYKVDPYEYAPSYDDNRVYEFAGAFYYILHRINDWNIDLLESYVEAVLDLIYGVNTCIMTGKVEEYDYEVDIEKTSELTIDAKRLVGYFIKVLGYTDFQLSTGACKYKWNIEGNATIISVVCRDSTKLTITFKKTDKPPEPPQPPEEPQPPQQPKLRFYVHTRISKEVRFAEISGCGSYYIVPPALGSQKLSYACGGLRLGNISLLHYDEYFDYHHLGVGGFTQKISVELFNSLGMRTVRGGPLEGRRFSIYLFLDVL